MNKITDKIVELKTTAVLTYVGWLKGDDVARPMSTLRNKLINQGVNIDVIKRVYEKLKVNKR